MRVQASGEQRRKTTCGRGGGHQQGGPLIPSSRRAAPVWGDPPAPRLRCPRFQWRMRLVLFPGLPWKLSWVTGLVGWGRGGTLQGIKLSGSQSNGQVYTPWPPMRVQQHRGEGDLRRGLHHKCQGLQSDSSGPSASEGSPRHTQLPSRPLPPPPGACPGSCRLRVLT